MEYQPTDRYQNWFVTSLQTDINDTTSSFRLNKALNVQQGRLVIDPYDESNREIVKVTSVDGTLVYVERGDDHTAPAYHNEGAIVVMDVFAADLNDLYADWALAQVDLQEQQDAFEAAQTLRQDNFEAAQTTRQEDFEETITEQVSDVEALAFLAAHPVGSTYWNETVSTNPGSIYGGTWVQLKGVVLGGISDVAGSPFNVTAGTIIGADTHTLTEAQLPNISGYWTIHGQEGGTVFYNAVGKATGSGYGAYKAPPGSTGGAHSLQNPGFNFGSGQAHNNIQRTLVGYLWKRTA